MTSEENVDIEKTPELLHGKEAVIIRNIKKTFQGIGKTTVKAVQVGNMDMKEKKELFEISGCKFEYLSWRDHSNLGSQWSWKVNPVQHADWHDFGIWRIRYNIWL